ncbi:MAG: shikimate kinase [Desulfobacca sp.]|nr:shikimate kinase [Desulfobacca sp.]
MNHIILIGYRCTGKTSAGKKMAEELKLPFYDTDAIIIDRIGKTIREWVGEKGWESFRQVEKTVIKENSSFARGVIALGGGAVMDTENRETIKKNGRIIWLTADLQTIIERMKADPLNKDLRPPLSEGDWEAEVRETLNKRIPLYASLADFRVDTKGKTIEAIIEEICGMMREQGSE